MEYLESEQSYDNGSPIEVYRFTYKNESTYYTNSFKPLYYGGKPTTVINITRSSLNNSSDVSQSNIEVTVPSDFPLGNQILKIDYDASVNLSIIRYHWHPDTYAEVSNGITLWQGRIVGAQFADNTIVLNCENIFNTIERQGLNQRFSYSCRHSVYRVGCYASLTRNAYEATVTSNQGTYITLGNVHEAIANGRIPFYGGYISNSEFGDRTIIAYDAGGRLNVNYPYPNEIVGKRVTLRPGCDKTLTTCKDVFDNMANYGGFPFIPLKNPSDGGSL